VRVVCIGDSITSGQYLPSEQAWPAVLAELTGHEVLNAGVANETTRQGLERFPRHVQERSPDVVIIQFGLNDCNRWKTDNGLPRVSLGAYRENLIEMVERVQAFNAEPLIYDLTPTKKSAQHRRDRLAYRYVIAEITEEFDVEFISNPLAAKHLFDDIHPNAEGHRLLARRVANCLRYAS